MEADEREASGAPPGWWGSKLGKRTGLGLTGK